MIRNESLEKVLLEDLEAIEPYLVYGDWLSSAGDPRGELIALQCHHGHGSGPAADELLATHREELLGVLAGEDVRVTWRRGFVDEIFLRSARSDPRQLVDDLLRLPACLLLRKLEVRVRLPELLSALRELGLPRMLLELTIGSFDAESSDECSPGAVEELVPRLSQIESLRVRGFPEWLRATEPLRPHLRTLGIRSDHLKLDFLPLLFASRWSRLERLALWFGGDTTDHQYFRNHGYPWAIDPEVALAPLLEPELFPSLRALSVLDADFQERLRAAFGRVLTRE